MRTKIFGILISAYFFGAECNIAQATETPVPKSMGALGDSISVGAFAAYSRLDVFKPMTIIKILGDLWDSVSQLSGRSFEKRHLSWSAGIDPYNRVMSHAYRLKKINPNLRMFIAAQTGADMQDVLSVQTDALADWSHAELGQGMPDYVTFLAGANDICAKSMNQVTAVDTFESSTNEVLDQIFLENPDTKVMVGAIPPLELLVEKAGPAPFLGFGRFSKCQDLWNFVPLCKNVLRAHSTADHDFIARMVHEYNKVLARSVERLNLKHPDQIRLTTNLYDRGFSPDELAVDCFHPNIDGQKGIAEETWNKSWWTPEWESIREQVIRDNPPSKPKTDEEPNFAYEGLE